MYWSDYFRIHHLIIQSVLNHEWVSRDGFDAERFENGVEEAGWSREATLLFRISKAGQIPL